MSYSGILKLALLTEHKVEIQRSETLVNNNRVTTFAQSVRLQSHECDIGIAVDNDLIRIESWNPNHKLSIRAAKDNIMIIQTIEK